MQDFEGLGTFYLGAEYDLATRRRSGELVLYDSKDLVTHAVIVGMTGSGKTGLGIALLEEAALDGIPAIVIDPKGDLANLLLTFPDLRPSDFLPWIDADAARVKGVSVERLAEDGAARWKNGLAEWGQGPERIARLREAAEFEVYTPGSSAARGVSILRSFSAPSAEEREDAEAFAERVQTTVSSLLGLAGIAADPVQSREHILLSTIVQRAWSAGRSLELGALVAAVQTPGVERIGVLDLESFYPAKERFALALALNNLLASPGFAAWTAGEPLDPGELLYTANGKPRVAIFSIAHLSDAQRMFFVSLLLESVLGWVRRQRGTSSLRALLYMDEIAGYFPPVANPPSKAPLLTLMKQARAFGVGVVLATQNPVDLDYKGLANAGTWFVGRLQTERDKARLLDGLEGAAAGAGEGFDRADMERVLSQLSARVFLMNDVHRGGPVVFETRWAMSFLRGPMTRAELKLLAGTDRAASEAPASAPAPAPASTAPRVRPVLPADVRQFFVPLRGHPERVEYRPQIFASAQIAFSDAKLGVDRLEPAAVLVPSRSGPASVDWEHAERVELADSDLESDPACDASFAALPADWLRAKSYEAWRRDAAEHWFRTAALELLASPRLGIVSSPGESERDFRLRCAQLARERRDEAVEKLRAKYAPKLALLDERLRKREQALEVQEQQAKGAKLSTALSFGTALLSAFFGGKVRSAGNVGRAATAARGVGRSMRESGDVERAAEDVRAVEVQREELARTLSEATAEISASHDVANEALERRALRPKKSAITVKSLVLVWTPFDASSGASAW